MRLLPSSVPMAESDEMVAALQACHAHVRYTLHPVAGDEAWSPAYEEPELYPWLLSQGRDTP